VSVSTIRQVCRHSGQILLSVDYRAIDGGQGVGLRNASTPAAKSRMNRATNSWLISSSSSSRPGMRMDIDGDKSQTLVKPAGVHRSTESRKDCSLTITVGFSVAFDRETLRGYRHPSAS
jgi:Holliday junction resolvase-like predicted endonuclease